MDIEKLKEFLSDKRNRAFVKLGLYIIFFIFLGTICRMYPGVEKKDVDTPVVEETPIEKYGKLANYEYKYDYSLNDTSAELIGKVFRNNNYFTLNGQIYYEKDKVYLITEDMFTETQLNSLYLLKPGQIRSYVDKGKLVSKQEDYENNSTISKYSLPVSEFDSSVTSDELIYISLYEKDKEIYKVDLDLSNYIKLKDEIEVTNSLITIEYSNKGQVTNFIDMFDESKVIKKEL